jgi:hypothetical protein
LGLFALLGCGDSVGKCYPVAGKVTFKGILLKDAEVIFVPDLEKGNKSKVSAFGKTGQDGTFTLTTQGREGAPIGWYKVVVMTVYPGGPANPVAIPERYTRPRETDLSLEVVSSPSQDAYEVRLLPK